MCRWVELGCQKRDYRGASRRHSLIETPINSFARDPSLPELRSVDEVFWPDPRDGTLVGHILETQQVMGQQRIMGGDEK